MWSHGADYSAVGYGLGFPFPVPFGHSVPASLWVCCLQLFQPCRHVLSGEESAVRFGQRGGQCGVRFGQRCSRQLACVSLLAPLP